ncbi:ABC-2 type transport system ATP-binding protein [Haloechinothrix alba]|uniref:ABC-2 type transport system ATP-binding protein n=1 Tax=Haloechinothrix alba TaxID=664784 RepID=A0A238Y2L6_9PSEU|nr:ABC transporter ATP-binding protein [Haloechinothrix alba]SNR64814.1 ABC-2 type transport system ATP-binding protein [Haloechinothrix alba]
MRSGEGTAFCAPGDEGCSGSVAFGCENVVKHYGEVRAVDGVSFEAHRGEIFGIIGPNGAGKTTLVECIEGLRTHDSGSIGVLGLDPQRQTRLVRERTGVQFQTSALPQRMKVGEALDLFAACYEQPADWRDLLARLGLENKTGSYVETLSGGQRQRVFIALALVNDPDLVFLDELTTGLDPQARLAIWDVIRDIRDGGTTVVLTTHLMEEAERLCDRVAIVDHGRIVALGTVPELIAAAEVEGNMSFAVDGSPPLDRLRALPGVSYVEHLEGRVVVHGNSARFAQEVMGVLAAVDERVHDLRSEQPSLEDVFLELTGRQMREGAPA